MLDGKPIVVIATHRTKNEKTGDMIQTWILRSDVSPIDAISTGNDDSICGTCPHRRLPKAIRPAHIDGECYVDVSKAPNGVWKAYKRGRYTSDHAELYRLLESGQALRIGSYGDPAAAPYAMWDSLVKLARKWTGYTHQWRVCDSRFSFIVMASCETGEDERSAHNAGYRTFRTIDTTNDAFPAILCPASEEAGKITDCATCGLCSGTAYGKRNRIRSIRIVAHGKVSKARITRLTIGGK